MGVSPHLKKKIINQCCLNKKKNHYNQKKREEKKEKEKGKEGLAKREKEVSHQRIPMCPGMNIL